MYYLRPANERGRTQIGWLDCYHSFSFGEYFDSEFMGFSDLRVINDDVVAPGNGFATHPHTNMEIITVVLKGELQHKDNLGNDSITKAGEIQVLTAGSGILHSEFNPSRSDPAHFQQIWILANEENLPPKFEQKRFDTGLLTDKLHLVVSGNGEKDALVIHQDAKIYQSYLHAGRSVSFAMDKGRAYWLQVAKGAVAVNDHPLVTGDGLAIIEEDGSLNIRGVDKKSNFLLFDLRK